MNYWVSVHLILCIAHKHNKLLYTIQAGAHAVVRPPLSTNSACTCMCVLYTIQAGAHAVVRPPLSTNSAVHACVCIVHHTCMQGHMQLSDLLWVPTVHVHACVYCTPYMHAGAHACSCQTSSAWVPTVHVHACVYCTPYMHAGAHACSCQTSSAWVPTVQCMHVCIVYHTCMQGHMHAVVRPPLHECSACMCVCIPALASPWYQIAPLMVMLRKGTIMAFHSTEGVWGEGAFNTLLSCMCMHEENTALIITTQLQLKYYFIIIHSFLQTKLRTRVIIIEMASWE